MHMCQAVAFSIVQYDWDAATTMGFLREYDLQDEFKLNIECNHATLAHHSCEHELQLASAYGMLGNIDANTGDPQTVRERGIVLAGIAFWVFFFWGPLSK